MLFTGVVLIVIITVAGIFIYQRLSLQATLHQWKAMLEHEDFGTGLLSSDLTSPQFTLIEKWAAERGYFYEPKADRVSDDYHEWFFNRSDGTQLQYAFIQDGLSYQHELAVQVQQGDSITLADDEKFKPVATIADIPTELQLTSPYQDVIERWGIGTSWNRRMFADGKRMGSLELMYYAELADKNIILRVGGMGGAVSHTSLSIVQFEGARP